MNKEVLGENPDLDSFLDLHPIRRFATLEEVAEAVGFLSGPSASYITGETINMAGGAGI